MAVMVQVDGKSFNNDNSGEFDKSCEIKGGGQEMAEMVEVDVKKINGNNSGEVASDASIRQHKLT